MVPENKYTVNTSPCLPMVPENKYTANTSRCLPMVPENKYTANTSRCLPMVPENKYTANTSPCLPMVPENGRLTVMPLRHSCVQSKCSAFKSSGSGGSGINADKTLRGKLMLCSWRVFTWSSTSDNNRQTTAWRNDCPRYESYPGKIRRSCWKLSKKLKQKCFLVEYTHAKMASCKREK